MDRPALFFRQSPFPAAPSAERFCPVGPAEQAYRRLLQSIDRAEGPALVVGPAGTGKTIVCQALARAYEATYDVVFLAESRLCTRRALLQHILFHLGLPYRDVAEGELRLSLLDRLGTGGTGGRNNVLLIVDEAHALPFRLLEELRMISGVVRDGSPRVRMVLAGGMGLEERLADPRLDSLNQRVGARCYLHPLHRDESHEYIRHHLDLAGVEASEVIARAAIDAVHQASDGIPRLINQLMDRAIVLAEQRSASQIDVATVEEAWSDLQQLPAPFTSEPLSGAGRSSAESVVEFGSLDDREPAPTPAAPARAEPESPAPLAAADSLRGYESFVAGDEAVPPPAVDPALCFAFEAADSSSEEERFAPEVTDILADAPEDAGSEAVVCPPENPEARVDEWSSADGEPRVCVETGASGETREGVGTCEFAEAREGAGSAEFAEPKGVSDQSGPAERAPGEVVGHADASGTVVEPPFGDDFYEEVEIGGALRVALDDTNPAGVSATGEVDAQRDDDGPEESLCREVISLNAAASHHARREAPPREVSGACDVAGTIADISLADDSDMLVVEEDVPVRSGGEGRRASSAANDLDYRSLFSKLRQG